MASRFSIEAVYKAVDQMSGVHKKIEGSNKRLMRSLKTDFAKAERSVMNFGNKFQEVIKNGILLGAGIAAAGIGKFVYDSIEAWDQQVLALKSVEATLESTNGIVKRSLSDLENQASSLQKNTFFGDDAILQHVTAQMLTFTNITGTQFDRAQKSVLDVTAKLRGLNATGEDLQGITIQLSKALNDPVANLSALSRSGIQFSAQQKDIIKGLAESGQLWKAQDLILTEIEKQYGGTATALTQTAAGLHKQNMNMLNDMQETIGKGIEPFRLRFLKMMNDILQKVDTEKLSKTIDNIGNGLFKAGEILLFIFNIVKPLLPFIIGLVIAQKAYNAALMFMAFIDPLLKFIKAVGLLMKAQKGLNVVQAIYNALLIANPIGLIIVGIGILIGLIILLILNWNKVVNVVKIVWGWIVKLWDAFKGFVLIIGYINPIYMAFVLIVEIIRSIADNWNNIIEAFKSEGILGGILAIGKAIVSGILAPIQSLFELLSNIPGVGGMFGKGAQNIANFRSDLFKKEGAVSPTTTAERSTYSKTENIQRGEVTINDNSGKASMDKSVNGVTFKPRLATSGGF